MQPYEITQPANKYQSLSDILQLELTVTAILFFFPYASLPCCPCNLNKCQTTVRGCMTARGATWFALCYIPAGHLRSLLSSFAVVVSLTTFEEMRQTDSIQWVCASSFVRDTEELLAQNMQSQSYLGDLPQAPTSLFKFELHPPNILKIIPGVLLRKYRDISENVLEKFGAWAQLRTLLVSGWFSTWLSCIGLH